MTDPSCERVKDEGRALITAPLDCRTGGAVLPQGHKEPAPWLKRSQIIGHQQAWRLRFIKDGLALSSAMLLL